MDGLVGPDGSWLIDRNCDYAGSHHAESTRRSHRDIDNSASHKWAPIAALYGPTGARRDRQDGSHRSRSVRACHAMPASTVIRSQAVFGFSAFDKHEKKGEQWRSIISATWCYSLGHLFRLNALCARGFPKCGRGSEL